jgi:hypothetical protein
MDFMVDADLLKELHTLSTTSANDEKVREAAEEALMEILVALRDDAICEQNEDED